MGSSDTQSSWGISHLSDMPITLTFGVILLVVLIVLVLLRLLFADVNISARGGVR